MSDIVTASAVALTADLFNFADTSDLPTEVAERLAAGGGESPLVQTIIALVNVAGRPVTLVEVIGALHRVVEGELPTENTLRKYINTAVETGRLSKPTRQTYAAYSADVVNAEPDAVDPVEAEVQSQGDVTDPLADLI